MRKYPLQIMPTINVQIYALMALMLLISQRNVFYNVIQFPMILLLILIRASAWIFVMLATLVTLILSLVLKIALFHYLGIPLQGYVLIFVLMATMARTHLRFAAKTAFLTPMQIPAPTAVFRIALQLRIFSSMTRIGLA